jgi:IclR family transcriptional regulator, KDG regulon repressor
MRHAPYKVQVIDRVLALLEILAANGPAMTLAELARRVDLPKSTVLRLLAVLQRHRFVERESSTGDYRLGLKLLELGSQAAAQFDFGDRARAYLDRLMSGTGESVFLSVLDGAEVLAIARSESARTVRVPLTAGLRTPAYCTANGKAILAYLSAADLATRLGRRKLHAYTNNTLTTRTEIEREMRSIRAQGYAVDHEEMEEGLKCIAAPVRNHTGSVVASVGILGPAFRIPDEKIAALAKLVVRAADDVSFELGYRKSNNSISRASSRDARMGAYA